MPASAPYRARGDVKTSGSAATNPGALIVPASATIAAPVAGAATEQRESAEHDGERERVVVPFGRAPDRDGIERDRRGRGQTFAAIAGIRGVCRDRAKNQRERGERAQPVELRERPKRRERAKALRRRPRRTPGRRRTRAADSPTAKWPPQRSDYRAEARRASTGRFRCAPSRRTRHTRRRRSRRVRARTTRTRLRQRKRSR